MLVTSDHIEQLIRTEADIHYGIAPPPGRRPFIYLDRRSPVLLSAPHGCRSFRNRKGETWHDEDEYTAGMALLLAELCQASVIATIWRTDDSDPNDTYEADSAYKRALRRIAAHGEVRCVIDLHGSGEDSANCAPGQLVDLGLGPDEAALPPHTAQAVRTFIEQRLGPGATERAGCSGFPAARPNRTITAFAYQSLGLQAVQIEMKPSVRVAWRRVDSTLYGKQGPHGGPFHAPPERLLAMLQALVDIIQHFQTSEKVDQ